MVQVKTERTRKLAGIILVLTGIAVLSVSVLEMSVDERVNQYHSSVSVYSVENTSSTVNLGINAGKNLDFGDVPEGTNVTKKIRISTSVPSKVRMEASGNISDYLKLVKSKRVEGETVLPVKINPTDPGDYSGTVTMKIIVPKGEIGRKWMEIRSQF